MFFARTPSRILDKFTYLGSSVSSTEKDIDTRLTKAWTAINRQSIIWKSDLTDKMKRSFFQAAVVSILLYGCTTCTLTKRLEKKLDGNYTKMQKEQSWTSPGATPHKTQTIRPPASDHENYPSYTNQTCSVISDVLLWTPTYGREKAGRPARTYIQQLCEDTEWCPEDLPEAMNNREKWRERVRDIRVSGTTWWWWFVCVQLNVETVLSQTKQFNISAHCSSFLPIERTLSGATTPGKSGLWRVGNKGVLCIPQSPSITGASPSDCLVSYLWHT